MKRIILVLGLMLNASPSWLSGGPPSATSEALALQIRWQRLVNDQGETCDRCGVTGSAVNKAVNQLRRCLKPLKIRVILEQKSIGSAEFAEDPLQSNRIWIMGKPLEDWISAQPNQSLCSSACGSSNCRTLVVDGKTYEGIPAELIIKAGLLAAAHLYQGGSPALQPSRQSEQNHDCGTRNAPASCDPGKATPDLPNPRSSR